MSGFRDPLIKGLYRQNKTQLIDDEFMSNKKLIVFICVCPVSRSLQRENQRPPDRWCYGMSTVQGGPVRA